MTTAIIKPQWSPLTIALMVLGFIIFWPLGLAMLAYIIWGEKFGGSAEKAQHYWNKGCGYMRNNTKHHGFGRTDFTSSGNAAFDEYRAEQLKRLEEERARLGREIRAGLAFRAIAARLNDLAIDRLIELARVDGIVPLLKQTADFNWHQSAARALLAHTEMDAKSIATEALNIAGDICIYTNRNIVVEQL